MPNFHQNRIVLLKFVLENSLKAEEFFYFFFKPQGIKSISAAQALFYHMDISNLEFLLTLIQTKSL